MAEEPAPTYRVEKDDDGSHFTCLVPDLNGPEGICGHEATNLAYFTMHMEQRHGGVMAIEPAPKGDRPAQAAVRQVKAQVAERQGEAKE